MQDLLALKEALEKPGMGKYRHDLAESFRGKYIPRIWIREWLKADWHTIGCKYLWLAAMNACIEDYNVPASLVYQGLCKPDPDTFNAAIEACRRLRIGLYIRLQWYDSPNPVFRIAAMTTCVNSLWVPVWFIEKGLEDTDIRVRRLAKEILKARK